MIQNSKQLNLCMDRSIYKQELQRFKALYISAHLSLQRLLGLLSLACSKALTPLIAPNLYRCLIIPSDHLNVRICDDYSNFRGEITSPEQLFDSPGQSNYENLMITSNPHV